MGGGILEDLILKLTNNVNEYNQNELDEIKKAILFARNAHHSQKRKSGEEYIIHPLNVAIMLSELKADKDTLIAALLHDVIEDTKITQEEISEIFNETVGVLVDGVTKLSKKEFIKNNAKEANIRKMVMGVSIDVRIIIIKLIDRVHNMRTLEFLSKEKQERISLETLEIYAPLAYYLGAFKIKRELEDLALKYLDREIYDFILFKKREIIEDKKGYFIGIQNELGDQMFRERLDAQIDLRFKNIYRIYVELIQNNAIESIPDLCNLKILVNEITECYQALGIAHGFYQSTNTHTHDYIGFPKKGTDYRAIHTRVYGPTGDITQIKIATHEMDYNSKYGLIGYWGKLKGVAGKEMLCDIRNTSFYQTVMHLDDRADKDNETFILQLKEKLFNINDIHSS